jgi:hypothetical protein
MRGLFWGAVILAALSLSAPAEIYRWVDENGVTHYSDKPARTRGVTVIDATPHGVETDGTKDCLNPQCRLEKLRALRDEEAGEPLAPRHPEPPPVRGLEFATFIKLSRGMTEGEILARTGMPDIQNFDGTHEFSAHAHPGAAGRRATTTHVLKTYTYLPTAADPFTTVVTFSGGRVANIERIKQF